MNVSRPTRFSDSVAALALVAIWAGLVCLVNPRGDFPLNDDWSYAQAVRRLVAEHRLEIGGWTSMSLVAQVLWGALFAAALGTSAEVLRLSTLVLGAAGVLAAFAIGRSLHLPRTIAFLAALTVAVSPLYFHLACTFMTDVPFAAFALISVACLLPVRPQGSALLRAAGVLFATLATCTRQLGLAVPIAALLSALRRRRREELLWAAAALVVAGGTFAVYQTWLVQVNGVPPEQSSKTVELLQSLRESPARAAVRLALRAFAVVVYMGVFSLPWACVILATKRGRPRLADIAAAGVGAAGLLLLVATRRRMPLLGNVLFDAGLGPLTLRDVYVLEAPGRWPTLPGWFWWALTVAGVASGMTILRESVVRFAGGLRTGRTAAPFLVLVAALSTLPVAAHHVVDRFTILPTILGLLVAARSARPAIVAARSRSLLVITLGLAGSAIFSVGATHDYLSWNRVRWDALRDLTAGGARAEEIDGGFEFNGSASYDPSYKPPADKSWWWVHDDRWVVAFGPIEGYTVRDRRSFSRWLPPARPELLVLKRNVERGEAP